MSLYRKREFDYDSDSDYTSSDSDYDSDSDYNSDYTSESDSDSDFEEELPERITAAQARAIINTQSLDDTIKYHGNKQVRLQESVVRQRTLDEMYKSLSKKKSEINLDIHKQVLNHLEELAKAHDLQEIKGVAEMIKKHPFALQHVKDYPSIYRKVLGEYYIDFEKHF